MPDLTFTVGEIPGALTYTFLDANGTAIDLTGFDPPVFQFAEKFGGRYINPQENPATLTTPASGFVTYEWDGTELTAPGSFAGQIWVSDGDQTLASCVFEWSVCLGVSASPF